MEANVNGFSPIFDSLAEEFGLMTSAVFGVIWRHCQMFKGECTASQDTLSQKIGITTRALQKHLERLVESEYLEKRGRVLFTETPERFNCGWWWNPTQVRTRFVGVRM